MDTSLVDTAGERGPSEAVSRSPEVLARGARVSPADALRFGGLLALLVAATMSGLTVAVAIGGRHFTIRPDQVVLLLLLPAVVLDLLRRGLGRARSALHLPVLALLAINVVGSLVASPVLGTSLQGVALMTVYVAMYGSVLVLLCDRPAWPGRLLDALVVLGFVHALYATAAILLFAAGIDIGGVMFGQVGPRSVTAKSTFPEANLLAGYMVVVAIFSAVRLVSASGRRRRAAWLGGFCLTGVALVLTVTRAAWLSLLLGLLLLGLALLLRSRNVRSALSAMRPVALGLMAIALLSLVVCDPVLSRLWGEEHVLLTRMSSVRLLAGTDDCRGRDLQERRAALHSCRSIAGRRRMSHEAVAGWRERPLLGHGTFGGAAIGRSYWMSSMIQALYDTGALGAMALLAMYGVMVRAPWLASRRAADPGARDLYAACAIGNLLLALTSQVASFLWVGFPWVFMALTLAAVRARSRRASATTADDRQRIR